MTKLLCTIWALILNTLGISIFRTCFANAMEDENGESLMTGPPITSFLFASGVYTIVLNSSIFPTSFRKPKAYILCAYEFLAMSFFLEFSMACIWAPIDNLILTSLPNALCNILAWMNFNDEENKIVITKAPMAITSFVLTLGFFILSLHVTRSLDFSLLLECGWSYFCEYTTDRLWRRILSELPKMSKNVRAGRCPKKKRSRGRRRSSS